MTFDDVAALALPLPGVTLGTSYGTPAIKVGPKPDGSGGKLLARLREAERPRGDLVLRCEDGLRDALLATQPDVFHLTPHYEGYDWILVRLAAADPGQIAALVERAWQGLAPAKLRRARDAGGGSA